MVGVEYLVPHGITQWYSATMCLVLTFLAFPARRE